MGDDKDRSLALAYHDVSDAFKYYLENENNGRPIILAGFSQGSDMVYRLLEEYFGDEEMQNKLVAGYAIGWACTEDMVKEYPQIKPAQSADDLGVVISFDCEAPEVMETVVNPAGRKAYSINPRTRRREQRGGSLFGTLINREYTRILAISVIIKALPFFRGSALFHCL